MCFANFALYLLLNAFEPGNFFYRAFYPASIFQRFVKARKDISTPLLRILLLLFPAGFQIAD
jgi:hypothetical protein